ncbi:transposase [bacterium]|nr:transposase [bacterium]
MLPDDRQKTLDKFFSKIPEEIRPKIKEGCIDLKISYKNAIKKHFPKVQIVIDKFHLVKLANQSMEEIRRIIFSSTKRQPRVKRIILKGKEKISSIEELKLKQIFETFSDFPDLKASYIIKERIRKMYQMNSIEAAREYLKITILLLEESNSYYL